MTGDDAKLEALTAEVERELRSMELSESDREAQRRALLSLCSAKRRRPAVGTWGRLAIAVAIAGLVLGGALYYWMQPRPLEYQLRDRAMSSVSDGWIQSKPGEHIWIDFETKSKIRLAEQSAARIVASNTDIVQVELSRGNLVSHIEGNGRTRHVFQAGPYSVVVVGTVFAVSWDSAAAEMEVQVETGVVEVKGANLSAHGVRLVEGEHFFTDGSATTISAARDRKLFELEQDREETPTPESPEAAEPDSVASADGSAQALTALGGDAGLGQPRPDGPMQAKPPETAAAVHPESDWRLLYRQGEFKLAIEAVERGGWTSIVSRSGQEDLWRLAHAARYSRRGKIARAALTRIRQEFPSSRRARTAAYLLGQVSLELDRNPVAAKKWFERYLREAPNGRLSEEALGQLIDTCTKVGNPAAARRYAKEYLARYPGGNFARSAAALVGESSRK